MQFTETSPDIIGKITMELVLPYFFCTHTKNQQGSVMQRARIQPLPDPQFNRTMILKASLQNYEEIKIFFSSYVALYFAIVV